MSVEKTVVTPSNARRAVVPPTVTSGPSGIPNTQPDVVGQSAEVEPTLDVTRPVDPATADVEKPPVAKTYHFVKNFCVGDVFEFTDGTKFSFRLIQKNDGTGYQTNSFLKTQDEALAKNIREIAKNRHSGVVEVTA